MMSESDLKEFVAEATDAIQTAPQMNEAMTKQTILAPFLELLGWEFPQPAEMEYPVKAFGRQFRVDYAYVHDGTARAFLEAKGVETPLSTEDRDQLKAYLKNETAELGILTNGQTYEFYRRVTSPQIEVRQLAALSLNELSARLRVLKPFTAKQLQEEEADGGLDIIQERELAGVLRADKSEIASDIEQAIVDRTEDDVLGTGLGQRAHSQIEMAAKSTVDTLITQLEPEGHERRSGPDDDGDSGGDTETRGDTYWVRIVTGNGDTDLFETTAEYQSDLLAAAVTYLIEHESLIDQLEPLPYIPGKTRAILNDEPTYNDREMAQHREIAGGYYLEVNLSWSQKQREITRMADACDVTVELGRLDDEIDEDETP